MQDRVPTYPGRVTLTPVPGQADTYDMVRADAPTQEGMPLCKATLLDDSTCAVLGLSADAVPNDAFITLGVGDTRAYIIVTAYETGSTTPIPNVAISGILSATGDEVYTNTDGVARGFSTTANTTVSVNAEYADLTVTPQTTGTPLGKVTQITIYATRKTNTGYLDTTVSSSGHVRFTDRVIVDVHVVGGGQNGGEAGKDGAGNAFPNDGYLGDGGDAGYHKYQTDIVPNPMTRYALVVGAAPGGASSFMGVASTDAGAIKGGSKGVYYMEGDYMGWHGNDGEANTVKKYGTGATNFAGGGGASAGMKSDHTYCKGGAPFGGDAPTTAPSPGGDARGFGGGGGGAHGHHTMGNSTFVNGGRGYQGAVFFRWRYT